MPEPWGGLKDLTSKISEIYILNKTYYVLNFKKIRLVHFCLKFQRLVDSFYFISNKCYLQNSIRESNYVNFFDKNTFLYSI